MTSDSARRISSQMSSFLMALIVAYTCTCQQNYAVAFSPVNIKSVGNQARNIHFDKSIVKRRFNLKSSIIDEDEGATAVKTSTTSDHLHDDSNTAKIVSGSDSHHGGEENWFVENLREKIGMVDESRMAVPELASGKVDRIFSNISYKNRDVEGNIITQALHQPGSTIGAAALIAGTTVGAGVLALPTATAPSGFLPSSGALCIAWAYMTMSGLLIAELSINRMGQTGKQGVGLLELYNTSLGKLGWLGSASYFFLHYAVMVAYLSQGGYNLGLIMDSIGLDSLSSINGLDQILLAGAAGSLVYFASPTTVENFNNVLVAGVIATFVGIIGLGAGSVDFDFSALIALENQHPEFVVNAFPICFLSMVFHNVVPTVVTQLEGDRKKITYAVIIGSIIPLIMFLGWNGVVLGNIVNIPGALDNGVDPISLLREGGVGGENLGQLVGAFSELAITTSLIGFIYGLLDGWTDLFKLPSKGPEFDKWKPALYAAVFMPPLLFSLGNTDIFFQALDYGGAFGVSTLFLVLPPIMVWKQRYGDEEPLTIPPMVPFGKIPLGSMWKAAATLILEQGADKLGVFDFLEDTFNKFSA